MKTRSRILVFLAACVAGLCIFGLVRFLIHISKPEPVLIAHLSRHELITPSDSNLHPDTLQKKLSNESLHAWMKAHGIENNDMEELLHEILRYLTVHITIDLPEDPLVRYTNYYHLEIENESNKLFENVYVKFPSVEAVEVRGGSYGPTIVPLKNGRYTIGDIAPDEKIDVYAWNSRPFYVQEESSVVLRHSEGSVEIFNIHLVKPERSWVKENLFLVVLLGGLALFLIQKMAFVIRLCMKTVDPKFEKRVNLE